MMPTLSKTTAGYHMLMILSGVDGQFDAREAEIAGRFVSSNYPDSFEQERETQFLKNLSPGSYFSHFKKCMDDFYRTSSVSERASLVRFAMEMIKADHKITAEENSYLNELLTGWEPEHTG